MKRTLYNSLIITGIFLLLHSCGRLPSSASRSTQVTLEVDISEKVIAKISPGKQIAGPETVIITVTAPDITDPIVVSAGILGRRAQVDVDVPQGESRTFTLEITGPRGFIWYTGAKTVDLTEQQLSMAIRAEDAWIDAGNSSVDPAQITNVVWASAADAAFAEEIDLPPDEEVYFWGLAFYMGAGEIKPDEYEVAAYTGSLADGTARQFVSGNPLLTAEQWTTIPISWNDENAALISGTINIGLIYKTDLGQPRLGYEPKNSAKTWFFSPSSGTWLNVANDLSSINPGALAVRALFLRRTLPAADPQSLIAISPDGQVEKWPLTHGQISSQTLHQVR